MSNQLFSYKPLGGVGQVGGNMTLINLDGHYVLLDAGILFPRENQLGLNYLTADFTKIDRVDYVVITHAHEDHIGAISHIVKRFPRAQIFAPALAIELMQLKLSYENLSARFSKIELISSLSLSGFELLPIALDHSIPETYGLIIRHSERSFGFGIFSDFKIPEKRMIELTDEINHSMERLEQVYLAVDSTNITSKSKSSSEDDLYPSMVELLERDHQHVYVTLFASNLKRVVNFIRACEQTQRKLVLLGRSIRTYLDIGVKLGYLKNFDHLLCPQHEIASTTPKLILVSGCQGDFKSALRRVAMGDDKQFQVTSDDLFLFSSKTIPGNEFSVGQILNALAKKKCSIVTSDDALIHSSGHVTKTCLSKFYSKLHVDYLIPIHGEDFFLRRHIEFLEMEHSSIKGILLSNGDELIVNRDRSQKVIDSVEERHHLFFYGNRKPLEPDAIRERRKLAQTGLVIFSVDKKQYRYTMQGLTLQPHQLEQLEETLSILGGQLRKERVTEEDARITIRKCFNEFVGVKPVVVIHNLGE